MGDDACDDPRDGGGVGSWMTYDELAESRGFTRRAAVRLTQRQRLRRQPGNDGLIRVWVPTDLARAARQSKRSDARDDACDDARDDGGDKRLLADALAAFKDATAVLKQQLDQAEARASAEREQRETAERQLAQAVKDRDQLLANHNRAMTEVERLRAADQARRAAGRVARIRAAWRGE